MNTYQRLNNLIGWVTFALATLVYLMTLEPTASWWDCGEYISTAFKLQVGHPPGAPLFQIIGRFFTEFVGSDLSKVAMMINAMSALSSGLTIMFLFWSITMLAKKVVAPDGDYSRANIISILGSGFIGAMAYAFTDSFWFSAVEGEVYAMSSFFTALVFWAILRWEVEADKPHSLRWLVLIAYLMGLSIGVHLLNLLAIPAIVYVYYYKKFSYSPKGFVLTGIFSILILAVIMYGIIPDIVNLFGRVELFFVNSLGLPFNSGTVFFALSIILMIVSGLLFTQKGDKYRLFFYIAGSVFLFTILLGADSTGSFLIRLAMVAGLVACVRFTYNKRHILNAIILGFTFILIGYSSFLLLIIRANANTPINENAPTDAIGLLSYLNREQYGTWPLFSGQYYNAPVIDYKDGTPVYQKSKADGKYVIVDDRKQTEAVYDPRFTTIFPRMWSNQKPSHIRAYQSWGEIKGVPIQVTTPDGKTETRIRPTFGENLRFFFSYQVGNMYLRYFMWNFVGRQNDIQNMGGIEDGNWLSGINFVDDSRLGNQDKLPEHRQNPARNKFYFLPLLLGLIGLYYHVVKSGRDSFVVFLMFIMTGLAIIIYLNQTPYQPRERDYAYAGSFYAFAIWIGFGVAAIASFLKKFINPTIAGVVALVISLSVPSILLSEGYDDHNRAGKTAARDFAFNYLNSCAKDAVLFTNGDNDTFPLWYAQEVENYRTDIRVVNYMLAGGEWYIHQMMRKVYNSDPLPLTLSYDEYDKGHNDVVIVSDYNGKGPLVNLKDLVKFLRTPEARRDMGGSSFPVIPTRKVRIMVDTNALKASGMVPKEMYGRLLPYIDLKIKRDYIYKNDLMFLDLLATNDWKRPIYLATPSSMNALFENFDQYTHLEGIVYKFLPVKATNYVSSMGGVSVDNSFNILMNQCPAWGNLEKPEVVVDRESNRNSIIPKQSFMRLAQGLISMGRKADAIKALDRCFELFPNKKIPYDKYVIPMAEQYFQAGASDKGYKLSLELLKIFTDDIKYFLSMEPQFTEQYTDQLQEDVMLLETLSQLGTRYGNKELTTAVDKARSEIQLLVK